MRLQTNNALISFDLLQQISSLIALTGVQEMSVDEHPKPKTDAASLAKLPPVFAKEGTVTAGTASVSSGIVLLKNKFICYCTEL